MRFSPTILLASTLSLFLVGGVAAASNVVDLDDGNFDGLVGTDRPALVEFYAPWCGHCKNLAPVYEQLADAFAHQSERVLIAKTDADGVGRGLGSRFGVAGFPTLKWFPGNGAEPEDYQGGRDLDALVDFVHKKSKVKSNIKPPPPPAAVQVGADNFEKVVTGSGRDVLVAFTAPWCGHCKNMKAAYEKVASAFKSEPSCVVAQMNADEAANKPIASAYGVSSFPTIKFFPKDGSEPVAYAGARTEEAFIEYLNEHCGTHRTISGLLSETAGKVLPLDTLAASFFSAPAAKRPEIVKQAQEYLAGVSGDAKNGAVAGAGKANETVAYYVRAMERIMEKGENWLTKETARFAKLISSPSLAPTKLDELIIKRNILSSFVYKKVEDAASSAFEAAVDATASVKSAVGEATDGAKSVAGQATASVKSAAGQATDAAKHVKAEL